MITVFTNGVFDILHVGHVRLLQWARSLGDELIVGLNSDESTRRLKGETRPVIPALERQEILESLKCVTEVHIFEEDTPTNLIHQIRPDFYVKGPECRDRMDTLPGAMFVWNCGGWVGVPPWEKQHSSRDIIDSIRRQIVVAKPLPQQISFSLAGREFPISPCFTIRFVNEPDGTRPVLYENGKRVTAAWDITLEHHQPEDGDGRSA